VYLVNTPEGALSLRERAPLVRDVVNKLINHYYHMICDTPVKYSKDREKFKFDYELISLYFNIGNELVTNCHKYNYTKYLKDNNVQIMYFAKMFKKPTLNTDKLFLSYVEYKNE